MNNAHFTHTRLGAATQLIVKVFRLHGRLLAAGDNLVRDTGLTSARWQILSATADPLTASPSTWRMFFRAWMRLAKRRRASGSLCGANLEIEFIDPDVSAFAVTFG